MLTGLYLNNILKREVPPLSSFYILPLWYLTSLILIIRWLGLPAESGSTNNTTLHFLCRGCPVDKGIDHKTGGIVYEIYKDLFHFPKISIGLLIYGVFHQFIGKDEFC